MKYRIAVKRHSNAKMWEATPEKKKRFFWKWMGYWSSGESRAGAIGKAMNHIEEDKAEEKISPKKEHIYL